MMRFAPRISLASMRRMNWLLDLSRLRAGAALRLEPRTSIAPIVERALAEERADAASRGVEVTQDFEPDVAGSFDSALVERALANLVRNAVGVSREGQTVHVSYATHDEGPTSKRGRRWACVRVRDDGPGIPLELRDTLFQPFVSSAVPSSPKTLGVGLGLSLCREVAEAHGGRLEIGDRPRGAELLLWLPVFLLMISMQVHENTQRLERLERMLASKEGALAQPPNSKPGAVSS